MTDALCLPKSISVLGSTGSIGVNTLDVLSHYGGAEQFDIVSLTGHSNIALLAQQAKRFNAQFVVTADENRYQELKDALAETNIECGAGPNALVEAASRNSQWVMGAIVGMAGLLPTLTAAKRGADIALANKECLVSAGQLFKQTVETGGGRLLPVDSEHSAIWQLIDDNQRRSLDKIILTASGGPYRTSSLDEMRHVTAKDAAKHPNWSMGFKISIDSASMFNKALEMIEAMHLFNVAPEQIGVIVHPQSIVHSLVSYLDGSMLAHLGCPDMRTAIGYALSYPHRLDLPVERLDLTTLSKLDFEAPDEVKFPAIRLAREAMAQGGLSGAILNGAKEVALNAFIDGTIGFLQMADIVEAAMGELSTHMVAHPSMEDIFHIDKVARAKTTEILSRLI